MARLIPVLGVVLFGGVFAGACAESGSTTAEQDDTVSAQGFELFRRGAGSELSSLAVRASLHSLGSRLAALQADIIGDSARNGLIDSDPDDGGWDFLLSPTATSHSASVSPENLYGATGLVHWALLRAGSHSPRWHAAALSTALGIQNNAQVDSPPDFVYLVLLSDLTEDAGLSQLARARYDAKLADVGGARALAERVRDQRHAQGYDGLIAYDLAWLSLGASALDAAFPAAGYDADAKAYAEVIVQDLSASTPNFDYRDANEAFYVQGLAWSLVALARSHTAPELRGEVRSLLLDAQLANGAGGWNAAYPSANLQATAQSVQALALTQGARPSARRAEQRASNWLLSQQAANGGYLYSAAEESPSLDAEVGLALFLAGTSAGVRDGLSAEGVATATQALGVDGDSPPLAQPSPL
jgi:hypothetical protein